MSEIAQKLFNKIVKSEPNVDMAFGVAVREKLNDALEIRKISLTTDIYNNVETNVQNTDSE
tara:strand:+ start:317 stop:499 length:183 start_codon:yes stop_codon:yes gene_type:complete